MIAHAVPVDEWQSASSVTEPIVLSFYKEAEPETRQAWNPKIGGVYDPALPPAGYKIVSREGLDEVAGALAKYILPDNGAAGQNRCRLSQGLVKAWNGR